MKPYDQFLTSRFSAQWKKLGAVRRSGVATPLFSIHSKKSVGIGQFTDLKLLTDWCKKAGISIIQLLPLNDMGFNFRPYDAESSFALDPVYLDLSELSGIPPAKWAKEIAAIKKAHPLKQHRVHYGVKKAKLILLKKMFSEINLAEIKPFKIYRKKNAFWLESYCRFRVLKDLNGQRAWEEWQNDVADASPDEVLFYEWVQWQCYEQLRSVKDYASKKGIYIMGDLPFLVSRDSADVWAFREYFKLNLASGAPPDLYFAKGQRWGMPPYDWEAIAAKSYDYLVSKLQYAENFYDLFRIDHFVGIFRIWTIQRSQPLEDAGYYGAFDPPDESGWEAHGRRILEAIVKNTRMLPCAEDLGVVPACSEKVLEDYGIPGMEVQRWLKDWGRTYDFKNPSGYRPNSVAVISTHDMPAFAGWWSHYAGGLDENAVRIKCANRGVPFDAFRTRVFDKERSKNHVLFWKKGLTEKDLLEALAMREEEARDFLDMFRSTYDERVKFLSWIRLDTKKYENGFSPVIMKEALSKISESQSVFSVQLLQDWLSLDSVFKADGLEFRINVPGTMDEKNWSILMPFSLEKMLGLKINSVIKKINVESGRS